jgi:hypothetical protein
MGGGTLHQHSIAARCTKYGALSSKMSRKRARTAFGLIELVALERSVDHIKASETP